MTQTFGTPQDAEDAYYDALEEGDMNRLLDVWADTDDISCLLPMYPLVRGHKPVEEAFAHLFSRGQGVTLAISHIDWLEANDMAIHLVEETIQNVPPGQAAPPPFYATNIYTRTAEGWRHCWWDWKRRVCSIRRLRSSAMRFPSIVHGATTLAARMTCATSESR